MEDFIKNEKIIRYVGIFIIAVLLICTTVSSVKSYQLGRLCNQLRERISDAEDTNRRLAETIGNCKSICGDLTDSVDRNIQTARDAIELIEEIRVQVQSLEMVTGDWDSDSYYMYYDSLYGIE
jgi:hypothetical protein